MKKKLLIVGITMNAAGSERAFLSFASGIDYSEWDVTLLLAKKSGELLSLVPKEIKIEEMQGGEIFLLDKSNAAEMIFRNYIRKNPLRAANVLASCVRIFFSAGEKRTYAKHRLWMKAMAAMPRFDGEYDAAIAYWGDRTMFYVADKVTAKRKITWLHFDYNQPPREDSLYGKYFLKFEKVVTVSREIERSLVHGLPSVAERVVTVENRIDKPTLLRLSEEKAEMPLGRVKILTVGRVCEQKGYDVAAEGFARLVSDGFDAQWYIIGRKNGEFAKKLDERIRELGISEKVTFLGTTTNPYKYMRACDIYFQPSRYEGKPIAVEEAMALERAILVTDYTSAREQLDGGSLGDICGFDSGEIYVALRRLVEDKKHRDELSKRLSKVDFSGNTREDFRRIL